MDFKKEDIKYKRRWRVRPLCPLWIDTLGVVNPAKLNILGWTRSQLVLIVGYLCFICRLEPCIGWHNCYKSFLTFCYKSLDRSRRMKYFRMNHEQFLKQFRSFSTSHSWIVAGWFYGKYSVQEYHSCIQLTKE